MNSPLPSPAALQRKLPITDPRLRILVTINGAREREAFRNYDEDDFAWLIEQGYLVAFDISVHQRLLAVKDSSSRRELRIFPDSLNHYAHSQGNPKCGRSPYFSTWDRLILERHHEANISTPRASVILNCGPTHIINLIDARLLQSVTNYGRGPKGVAQITRDSFLTFLKSRLEGAC